MAHRAPAAHGDPGHQEPEEEDPPGAGWRHLVRVLLRLRRLQRYFGYIGQFLQQFGSGIREDLRRIYVKDTGAVIDRGAGRWGGGKGGKGRWSSTSRSSGGASRR